MKSPIREHVSSALAESEKSIRSTSLRKDGQATFSDPEHLGVEIPKVLASQGPGRNTGRNPLRDHGELDIVRPLVEGRCVPRYPGPLHVARCQVCPSRKPWGGSDDRSQSMLLLPRL